MLLYCTCIRTGCNCMENDWRMQECMQTSFVPQTCICILPQNQLVLIGCTLDKAATGSTSLKQASPSGLSTGLKIFIGFYGKRAIIVSCWCVQHDAVSGHILFSLCLLGSCLHYMHTLKPTPWKTSDVLCSQWAYTCTFYVFALSYHFIFVRGDHTIVVGLTARDQACDNQQSTVHARSLSSFSSWLSDSTQPADI